MTFEGLLPNALVAFVKSTSELDTDKEPVNCKLPDSLPAEAAGPCSPVKPLLPLGQVY